MSDACSPHVDSELQGVRADDGFQLAVEKLLLDFPPLLGKVPSPVRMNAVTHRGPMLSEFLTGVAGNYLAYHTRTYECDRLDIIEYEHRDEIGSIDVRAPALHLTHIDRGRVPEYELLSPPGGTIPRDDLHLPAEELLSVLTRICDGSR